MMMNVGKVYFDFESEFECEFASLGWPRFVMRSEAGGNTLASYK